MVDKWTDMAIVLPVKFKKRSRLATPSMPFSASRFFPEKMRWTLLLMPPYLWFGSEAISLISLPAAGSVTAGHFLSPLQLPVLQTDSSILMNKEGKFLYPTASIICLQMMIVRKMTKGIITHPILSSSIHTNRLPFPAQLNTSTGSHLPMVVAACCSHHLIPEMRYTGSWHYAAAMVTTTVSFMLMMAYLGISMIVLAVSTDLILSLPRSSKLILTSQQPNKAVPSPVKMDVSTLTV